jgi:Ca2+-binding EF-hand superfamily protein
MADELPPAVKDSLLKVFTVLDRDGTMSLTLKDITKLMNTMLRSDFDEMQIAEIMSEVCDSDAPGVSISFDMFCRAVGPLLVGCTEDEISQKAFAAMDVDGSGCISASELAPLMSAVAGTRLTKQQTDDVLALAAGSDGKVRYKDYHRATAKS